MRREGCKELLARLHANARVRSRKYHVSNWDLSSALDLLNELRQVVLFVMLWPVPRNKVPHLPVVAVVGEIKLRSDEQDLAIEDDNTAVVSVVAVHDGHANVRDDAMDRLILKDDGELFPRVQIGITLQKVIEQAIARDFKSADMSASSSLGRDAYRTLDPATY